MRVEIFCFVPHCLLSAQNSAQHKEKTQKYYKYLEIPSLELLDPSKIFYQISTVC